MSGTVAIATRGPVVGGSASPVRLDVDLRTLPTLRTPPPGEPLPPATEVPIGILPPSEARAELGELGPGRYRVVVRYLVGSRAGPLRRAASRSFTVVHGG